MSASRFPGVPSSDRLLTQPEPLLGPGEGLGNRRPTIDGSMTWLQDACIARDIDIGALRMMYRRSFIGLIAGAVVVGATRGSNARSDRIGDIGVQLYTLRHEMQRDFEGTLARIAEIGYREVEFIELFGRAPRAARAMLDRHGLVAPSSHVGYDALGDRWPEILDNATILGQRFIVCPWIDAELRRKPDVWKHAAVQPGSGGQQEARNPVRVSQS